MKVLGADILSGSVNSRTQPKYSLVLLEDGEIYRREEVSRFGMMRTIREERPDRIACDNVFELFPKDRAKRFFSSLPQNTRLVQVTGSPAAPEPLHIVAKRNGIPLTSRAGSMEEAEACARLAYNGIGFVVSAFEDECRIIVSRARSMGRGGQSFERYRRKVHSMVALNIKEIKQLLDERGTKYELKRARADYGYSRGEFLAHCPRSGLRGIKQRKGPDIQIKILPVEKKKLEFKSLAPRDKSVILGIDPGTTTALAVIDLEGNLLEVYSSRNFSLSEVLSFTTKYDTAVVASDVAPAPKFVEKVASSLNAVLFSPAQMLSVADKIALAKHSFRRNEGVSDASCHSVRKMVCVPSFLRNLASTKRMQVRESSYSNPHERDALAAAIKAYSSYRNTLEQVDKKLEELRLTKLKTEVRKLVLRAKAWREQ